MHHISQFTAGHVQPLLTGLFNKGIVWIPALQVACAACQTEAQKIAQKIQANPQAANILQQLGSAATEIRNNPHCQTFATHFVGSVASIIPQELAPYLRTCSCLAGASGILSEIAHAGIHAMEGRAQAELAKPLPAQVAGAFGRGVVQSDKSMSASEIVQTIGPDSIGGPVGNHLAAQSVYVTLAAIKPTALDLITKTSTVTGGLEFLQGLFHLSHQLSNLTNPLIKQLANRAFQVCLGTQIARQAIQTFYNASAMQKIKQLALFAVIAKVAQIAHSKYKVNAAKVVEAFCLLNMPKTTAAKMFVKAVMGAGFVGGVSGLLNLDESSLK